MAKMILRCSLCRDVLDDNLAPPRRSFLNGHLPPAEPHLHGGSVLPLPFNFDKFHMASPAIALKQLRSLDRVTNDVRRQVCSHQFLFGSITEHCHQGFIDIEKLAAHVETADSVSGIFQQGAIVCFRAPQLLLHAILLPVLGRSFHCDRHGKRQMCQTSLVHTIGRPSLHKLVHNFRFQALGYENERNLFFLLLHERERLEPGPPGQGGISENNVVGLLAEPVGELCRRLNHIRQDGKLRSLELLQTKVDLGQIIINNEGPNHTPPVSREAASSNTSMLLMRYALVCVWHDNPPSYPPEPVQDSPGRLMDVARTFPSEILNPQGY